MKVLLQTQNPTLKTLVVVPPAGRTNSLLSFPPMWRHKVGTVWRGVGLGADGSDFKSSN